MSVLVDTSVWIEYFRSGKNLQDLDFLLDEDLVVTNELILAELIPFLRLQNQRKVIGYLNSINKIPLRIYWDQVMEFQFKCLKKGINGIGIPDLLIAQNASQYKCRIFTLDKHFRVLAKIIDIDLLGG
jgi:hypothetical protein